MAMIAILAGMALPSFLGFINKEKMEAVSEEFSKSVIVARSAAIKTGIPVIMCASSDGEACSSNWSDGWIAFVDDDRDRTVDNAETVILTRDNDASRMQVAVSTLTGTVVEVVGFNYRGAPDSALSVTVTSGTENVASTVTPFGKPRRHD